MSVSRIRVITELSASTWSPGTSASVHAASTGFTASLEVSTVNLSQSVNQYETHTKSDQLLFTKLQITPRLK